MTADKDWIPMPLTLFTLSTADSTHSRSAQKVHQAKVKPSWAESVTVA